MGLARWVAVAVAATGVAQAQPPTLDWDAPAGCPTADDVVRDVERLLGRSPPIRAMGRVRHVGPKWILRLRVAGEDGAGEREVEGESCQEVAVAAASIIALAVEPNSDPPAQLGDQAASPLPVESKPLAAPEELEPPAQKPAQSKSARRGVGLVTGVHGALDARTLPNPAPGLGLDVGLLVCPLRVDLYFDYFPQQRASLGPARTDVSLLAVGLRPCVGHRASALDLWACGLVEGGRLRAESSNVTVPGDGTGRWWAAGLGLQTGWRFLPELALAFGGDVLAPLVRDEFVIEGRGVIHRPPALTGRALIGLESTLW